MKSPMRRSSVKLVLASSLPLALTACSPQEETYTVSQQVNYGSVEACVNDKVPEKACNDAYKQALAEYRRTAPTYVSKPDCEAEFAPDGCQIGAGGRYMPRMSGFELDTAGEVTQSQVDAARIQRRERAELFGHLQRRVVGQHDAASADADGRCRLADMGEHDGRGGRCDAGHAMMFGHPEAVIAQCFDMGGQIGSVGKGGGHVAAFADRDEIKDGEAGHGRHMGPWSVLFQYRISAGAAKALWFDAAAEGGTARDQRIGVAIEQGHGLGKAGAQRHHGLDQFVRALAKLDAAACDHFDLFGHGAEPMGAELGRFALQRMGGADEGDGIAVAKGLLDGADRLFTIFAEITQNAHEGRTQLRAGPSKIVPVHQFGSVFGHLRTPFLTLARLAGGRKQPVKPAPC